MHARIGVIAIDRTGRVVGTTCLYPNRLVLFAKASLILEVPWCSRLPKLGAQLVAETKRVDRTDIEANKVCKGHDGEGRTAGRC
ncbi:MAG: hypothetical protein IIC71_08185 [Acidobacteria bacterium]|nr:hypothetical protein [Acidobacteriota bacterium]